MISRENYLDVKSFLKYLKDSGRAKEKSIDTYWSRLRHLLEWAQEENFSEAKKIETTFPMYLERITKNRGQRLGASTFTAICKTARSFFEWAHREFPKRYKTIDDNWIGAILPPRARREQSELKTRDIYQVEEVIKLATYSVSTLCEKRTQAAAALLFLSGMRITAFVSLPINCVDLQKMKIYQLPNRGVLVKNNKAQVTTLLAIPDLLNVVSSWDGFLRENLPDTCLWYPNLDHEGVSLKQETLDIKRIQSRPCDFRGDLKSLCEKVGIRYKSPHKFRHGHAVYGIKNANRSNNPLEMLKAISQNLGHSSVGITDSVYGKLAYDDVHDIILGIGPGKGERKVAFYQPSNPINKEADEELVKRFAQFLELQRAQQANFQST